MRIFIPFKVIPDLDGLRASDWAQSDGGAPDLTYCKRSLNSYDESALEWALRFADAAAKSGNEGIELFAATVGGHHNETVCKTLTALPFTCVTQIEFSGNCGFNTRGIAHILSAYAQSKGPFDLILTGQQSGVGDQGLTPAILASHLNYPCFYHVRSVSPHPQGFEMIRNADGGTLRQIIAAPAVLSIGDSDVNYLRVPTLRQRMQARPFEIMTLEELGISLESTEALANDVRSLAHTPSVRTCQWIAAKSSKECAEKLVAALHERGAL